MLDQKYGSYRVTDPADNVQLAVYALLAISDDDAIGEVTVQILSPHFDFEPFTYSRAQLDQLYQSVLVVINSLSDPGDPTPGGHCQFCQARLICRAARTEVENASLAKVIELPLGEGAAKLLTQIRRARSLFAEIEQYYCTKFGRSPKLCSRLDPETRRSPALDRKSRRGVRTVDRDLFRLGILGLLDAVGPGA